MQITRRAFSLLALATGAGLAGGLRMPRSLARMAEQSAGTVFDWKPVGDFAFLRAGFGQGGNALVIAGADGALLVDCKLVGFGEALRREAGTAAGVRLTRVVNTHHHADHTGGNTAFVHDLPVLAQSRCGPRVAAQLQRYTDGLAAAVRRAERSDADPGLKRAMEDAKALLARAEALKAEDFAPTQSMDREATLDVGGVRVELRYVGPGHTDNDVFVFLPKQNVLHTGDLLFNKLHPVVDVANSGADTVGWQKSIDAMLALCDERTIVVPGHGEITDAAALRAQRKYFDDARAAVDAAIKAGATRDAVGALPLPGYADYGFQQMQSRALLAIYDELSGKAGG